MTDRTQAVRRALARAECAAFFSLARSANQYLTGFLGSTSGVIVTETEALFLCDFRYVEQAARQVQGYEVQEVRGNLTVRLGERLRDVAAASAAFEPACVTVDEFQTVEKTFQRTLKLVPGIVGDLRRVKSEEEIEKIRAASRLAEGVLSDLLETVGPGLTERELAARFEYEFKKRGASGASFDPVVLFGARSSLPHGEPGDKALAPGDIVLLDLGCRMAGYCSDLTRTYVYGTIPGAWFEEIYDLTLAAQKVALEAVRPGIGCREVDAAARDLISEAGHGEHFGHGVGHGVGIEIHEAPRLNPGSETVLEAGMVITIEPGVYVAERGGVRIEDLVVVTADGCAILTSAPKELKVLGT